MRRDVDDARSSGLGLDERLGRRGPDADVALRDREPLRDGRHLALGFGQRRQRVRAAQRRVAQGEQIAGRASARGPARGLTSAVSDGA